jgi:hypothetical protein
MIEQNDKGAPSQIGILLRNDQSNLMKKHSDCKERTSRSASQKHPTVCSGCGYGYKARMSWHDLTKRFGILG